MITMETLLKIMKNYEKYYSYKTFWFNFLS